MTDDFEAGQGKSAGDLGKEAMWFVIHTILAVVVLMVVIFAIYTTHPDPDAANPKYLGTLLALFVPMIAGFIIAKVRQDRTAKYVWISGMLMFGIVCVWVLDLPTGNGLCDKCGALDKLSRTFFDVNNGSGLMGGDGLLIGTWVPLSMIGYAIGARFGLDRP